MTWPKKDKDKDRYKDKDNDKDIKRAPSKSDPKDLWPLQRLIRVMRTNDGTKKRDNCNDKYRDKDNDKDIDIFREHLQRAILETCEIWDTGYNFDNWEPEFMTICVTWQLGVTLDSIRNSCDVLLN